MKIRFTLLSLILALYSFQIFAVEENYDPYEDYYAEFYGIGIEEATTVKASCSLHHARHPVFIPKNTNESDEAIIIKMADPSNFYNG